MIVKAYQYQNDYNKLLFIFSSKDFNDLYTRLKYLKNMLNIENSRHFLLRTHKKTLKNVLKHIIQNARKNAHSFQLY